MGGYGENLRGSKNILKGGCWYIAEKTVRLHKLCILSIDTASLI